MIGPKTESTGWKVARLLKGQGYEIAGISGLRKVQWPEPFFELDLGYDVIGILEERNSISIAGISIKKKDLY